MKLTIQVAADGKDQLHFLLLRGEIFESFVSRQELRDIAETFHRKADRLASVAPGETLSVEVTPLNRTQVL
jgi:hypothetical protein